ncbi:MAG: EamA family transporter [Candidatus Lokiarchaeota archaeon]|nr:EamA family transporter [Candidatus Lokiarchaeota archaeon]
MDQHTKSWLAILFTTLAWGSSIVFAKFVYTELTPMVFLALRYTIACPPLYLLGRLLAQTKPDEYIIRENWRILLAAGISGPFVSQALQYIGLGYTTASDTVLLINFAPLSSAVLAVPLLNESMGRWKITGMILAIVGASFIVLGGASVESAILPNRVLGDLLVLGSTFFFALNGIFGKMAVKTLHSLHFTFVSILFSIPFLWLSAIITEDLAILLTVSLGNWLLMLWIGIVNTAVSFALYYEAHRHIDASTIQIGLNMVAVWGVLLSVLLLAESVTLLTLFGGALTVVGVILAQAFTKRNRTASEKTP